MKVAAGAVCALHPSAAAIDVCTRCGSFVCEVCEELSVTDEVFCTACYERVKSGAPTLRSHLGRGLLAGAVMLLVIASGVGGFTVAVGVGLGVPGLVLTGLERWRRITVPKWVLALGVVYLLQVALYLVFVVLPLSLQ